MPKRSFHLLGLAAAVCMLAGAQSKTAAEGKPAEAAFDPHDLSGEWWAHTVRGSNFSLSAKAPAMTAWAQAKYDAAKPGLGPRGKPLGNDPIMICDPMGSRGSTPIARSGRMAANCPTLPIRAGMGAPWASGTATRS